MVDRVQTKLAVRARLQGCWGRLFLACVIPSVAPQLLNYFVGNGTVEVTIGSMVLQMTSPPIWLVSLAMTIFVVAPMQVALCGVLLRFLEHPGEAPAIAPVFSCFSTGYMSLMRGMLWYCLMTELWGILFLAAQVIYLMESGILGTILMIAAMALFINRIYAYCMTPYIVSEFPGISGREALRMSCAMTRGHRWELVVALGFSFFGWIMLGVVTFGIGMIYAIPYMRGVEAAYYIQMRPTEWGAVRLASAETEEVEDSFS